MNNYIKEESTKLARLQGTHFSLCASNSQTTMDFTTDRFYVMNGCQYYVENYNFGDFVQFQILMGSTLIAEYASQFYVCNGCRLLELYRTELPAGVTIRIIYNNVGTNEVKFWCNSFLHIDKGT